MITLVGGERGAFDDPVGIGELGVRDPDPDPVTPARRSGLAKRRPERSRARYNP
jgi:hypothetical protein